ncbi:MAG: hypothetical protein LH477_06270 [Nocardioides sp.]|nr:hypothetical protein [Nocardioides sp.]
MVVDRVMGAGEAQSANDRIAALIREVPFPVYVALVEQPDGLPEDSLGSSEALAVLLNRRMGDGLYVIATTESPQRVWSYGLGADPSRLSLSAYANADALDAAVEGLANEPVSTPKVVEAEAQVLTAESLLELGRGPYLDGADYPATLADADADIERLAQEAVRLRASSDWRPGVDDYVSIRTASSGLSALVGVVSALVVGLLFGQTLRGWPRRRKPLLGGRQVKASAAAAPPHLETERARARELVDALTRKLSGTDWEKLRDRDVAGRALTARDAVEPLLESDDVADLIGAQVVARAGARDLARGRRGSGDPLGTCYFDPRHPEPTAVASWRLGDGEVEVPCCAACSVTVGKGGVPDHLRLGARRGTVPYWERDDVWARTGFGAVTDDLARDVLAARAGER